MLDVLFDLPDDRTSTVLCVGAHSDDIEIGCLGTLISLGKSRRDIEFVWAVFSGDKVRQSETKQSVEALREDGLSIKLRQSEFPDGHLPYVASPVKESMELLKSQVNPDLIFSHWLGDRHQDHRFLSELTWNTFRDHLILEYEVAKYDGDFGNPNVFVPLDTHVAEQKSEHLLRCFPSQARRQWFDRGLFEAVLRLRGMECRSESGFAEAFYCRKVKIRP